MNLKVYLVGSLSKVQFNFLKKNEIPIPVKGVEYTVTGVVFVSDNYWLKIKELDTDTVFPYYIFGRTPEFGLDFEFIREIHKNKIL